MDHPVAALFELPDHAAPAAQGEQRRREEVVPLLLGNAQQVERFQDRVQRTDVRVFAAGPSSSASPRIQRSGGPAGWRYKEQKAR